MENFTLQLPKSYSAAVVRSFHGRDREGLAETVTEEQIRIATHRLRTTGAKPTSAQTQSFLESYQPHRSMAAAHLWASL